MKMKNVKFYVMAMAICFFGFCQSWLIGATLTGPTNAEVGRLVTINSSAKGDWMIYPPNAADFAKDSDEKTLYFVARQQGTFTIIFFGVEGNKPVISQMDLNVGPNVTPNPEPSPSPSPNPDPAPVSKMTPEDKAAVVYSLQRVISGIDNGTIVTPNAARSTFKQAIMSKGQVCNGYSCHLRESLSKIADELTDKTNFDSTATVKESFENLLKEVEK